ncbi:conserved protein, unknown function [Hepatocystis sp. ex Piliocolobus tephrosceles]|nr:conserved protein, unknown function [Hepatocystis sp. ex Piliocolobus tephrosceles]
MVLLYILYSLVLFAVAYTKENINNQAVNSPVLQYGFINNEHYKHYLPSKDSNILKNTDLITISCQKGYTVAVKKAIIIDLNEEENDYTQLIKEICSKKAQCKIDVRQFKIKIKHNAIDATSELILDYICISSENNLYDGRSFHQGITQKYLTVRDRTIACVQNSENVEKMLSISKALEKCSKNNCTYVVWNAEEKKAVICYENNSHDLIEKKNNITYINPTFFYTYGFATFLNYMSICENVVKSVPYNLSMGKSVDVCSHLDCAYFTKSYAGSIRSLNNNNSGKSWFCKGFPTIVPMDGFITSVNLRKFN